MSERETDVAHLVDRRDLTVPDEDRAPLAAYWRRMRELRGALDERLLGDAEPATTWTARTPDAD